MSLNNRAIKPYPTADVAFVDTSEEIITGGGTPFLEDDFDDNSIDTAKWNTDGSTISETSQQLQIATTSGAFLISDVTYNMADKVVEVEAVTVPVSGDFTATQLLLATSIGGSFTNATLIDVQNGSTLRWIFDGALVGSTTYNSAVHKFWRMRFDNSGTNTLYFEYSTDGTTWSSLGSSSLSGITFTSAMYAYVRLANSTGLSHTAIFDNFWLGSLTGGVSYTGQVAITWKNRNRTTGLIKKQTAATETLESGQTTTIRIYGEDGTTLLRTVTGLTGTSYDYTAAFEVADAGSLQDSLTIKIKSVRDGHESAEVVKTVTR